MYPNRVITWLRSKTNNKVCCRINSNGQATKRVSQRTAELCVHARLFSGDQIDEVSCSQEERSDSHLSRRQSVHLV